MVELSGIIDSDFLEKCENKCKILVSMINTSFCCFVDETEKISYSELG